MYPESAKNIATENEERKECDECKNSTGEQHLRAAYHGCWPQYGSGNICHKCHAPTAQKPVGNQSVLVGEGLTPKFFLGYVLPYYYRQTEWIRNWMVIISKPLKQPPPKKQPRHPPPPTTPYPANSQNQEVYGRGAGEPYACERCTVERQGDPPAPDT